VDGGIMNFGVQSKIDAISRKEFEWVGKGKK